MSDPDDPPPISLPFERLPQHASDPGFGPVPRDPAEVFHIGEYIADELAERGWSTRELAERMGWRREPEIQVEHLALDLLIAIRDVNLLIGPDMPDRLARAFGTSAEYWAHLDAAWRRWMWRKSLPQRPVKVAP